MAWLPLPWTSPSAALLVQEILSPYKIRTNFHTFLVGNICFLYKLLITIFGVTWLSRDAHATLVYDSIKVHVSPALVLCLIDSSVSLKFCISIEFKDTYWKLADMRKTEKLNKEIDFHCKMQTVVSQHLHITSATVLCYSRTCCYIVFNYCLSLGYC